MSIVNNTLNQIDESASQFQDLANKDGCTTRIINGWRVIDNCIQCSQTLCNSTNQIFNDLKIEKLLSDIRNELYSRYHIDSNYDITDMGMTYRLIIDSNKESVVKLGHKIVSKILTSYSKKASEFCGQPHGGDVVRVDDYTYITPPTQICYGDDRAGRLDSSWSVVFGEVKPIEGTEQISIKIRKDDDSVYLDHITDELKDAWDLPKFI